MEMQEITAEKEKKEEDEGASKQMPEDEIEEEAGLRHYCRLHSKAEDVYMEAYDISPLKTRPDKKDEAGENLSPESKLSVELEGKKAGSKTQGNVLLYRAVCLFLSIICLVLLLVVIILGLKLQTGSTVCTKTEETTTTNRPTNPSFGQTCRFEQCQALFPNIQHQRLGCQQCADGWLPLGRSCFYLSTFRLSWDKSQKNCTARGGSLAVITSQKLQNFLTKEGKLKYWIGLRRQGPTWTWVNNTALEQSYWADAAAEGDCGILSSKSPAEKNWMKASCQSYTYFICQLQY